MLTFNIAAMNAFDPNNVRCIEDYIIEHYRVDGVDLYCNIRANKPMDAVTLSIHVDLGDDEIREHVVKMVRRGASWTPVVVTGKPDQFILMDGFSKHVNNLYFPKNSIDLS